MPLDRQGIGRVVSTTSLLLTRSRLRQFARATGQTDPIYTDLDAARAVGHPDLPAPPTFLFSIVFESAEPFGFLVDLGADLHHVLHGEQAFDYRRLAYAGEELSAEMRIADIYDKRGGELEFVVTDTVIGAEDGRQQVATLRNVTVVQNGRVAEGVR